MQIMKKVHIQYHPIFMLLAVSFLATLLLLECFLKMRASAEHASQVQQQCEFRTALTIFQYPEDGEGVEARVTIENPDKAWMEQMPELPTDGLLSVVIEYTENDATKNCLAQYLFGNYGQFQFPLMDGGKTEYSQSERAVYAGAAFLPYIKEEDGADYLRLGGERVLVAGILDDITGNGADERLFVVGENSREGLEKLIRHGFYGFRYYSNKDYLGISEELEQFADWLEKGTGQVYGVEAAWQGSYISDDSFVMQFIKKAMYPVIVCCGANCLLILSVYIKKRKRNLYIRRMCGVSYVGLALFVAKDYAVILFPAIILIGLFGGQFIRLLSAGTALLLLFLLLSIVLIKKTLQWRGRSL